MPITFATPPQTRLLSTRARVYERLGITGEDAKTDALLAAASDEVEAVLGYGIARAEVIETFPGHGWRDKVLGWAPVLSISEVLCDGVAADASGFVVLNPEAAIVRALAWWAKTDDLDWSVRFWAGWLTPADDVTAATISFAAGDSSINRSSGSWPLLLAGDAIAVSGSPANSRRFTVVSRTDAKVVVSEAVTTEVAGASISVAVSNLPLDIEQAVIERVGDLRAGSTTSAGGAVTSIEADGVKKSFSTSSTGTTRVSAYDRSLLRRARIAL